jgi:hypothetical protein
MKLFIAAALAALTSATPSMADVIYQTATATNNSQGSFAVYGDGTDAGSNFVGAAFALTSRYSDISVGANFDQNGVGQIFVAIVPLATFNSLPTVTGANLVASLQASILGYGLLTAPASGGDASVEINAALPAGDYAAIFGSGILGATGSAGLADSNATIGSPNIFTSNNGDDAYSDFSFDTGIRVFEVPEPTSLALLSFSGVIIAAVRRRRAV